MLLTFAMEGAILVDAKGQSSTIFDSPPIVDDDDDNNPEKPSQPVSEGKVSDATGQGT